MAPVFSQSIGNCHIFTTVVSRRFIHCTMVFPAVAEEDNAVRGAIYWRYFCLGGKVICGAYCRHAKHAFSRGV